jgi:hypothetical protein
MNLDAELLAGALLVIAWHALDWRGALPAFFRRAALALELWRDPWLGYGVRRAWHAAGVLAGLATRRR